jgi:uncharacterized damage-inducible protein DinB
MRTFWPAVAMFAVAALHAAPAVAQSTDATNPKDGAYTKDAQNQFKEVSSLIVRTAEKVGEDLYSFKPTPEVRSLGAILGHVADDQNLLCRIAMGEAAKPDPVNEKKTSKAEIVAALKASVTVCDSAFAKINDTTGKEIATAFGSKMTKLGWLIANTGHDWEHYGNLVTYMRLKNIVPPSSEPKPKPGSAQ